MVGNIDPGSRSTTMDGPLDVPTFVAFPMWGSILDTSLWIVGSDQLCPCSCHKTVRDKAMHPSHRWISLTRVQVWPTGASSVAQSDDANVERSTQNEIRLDSRRMHFGVYYLEKTEDIKCSSSSRQNASLNFGSCSCTTINDRDYQIRVCFREIENGAEVSETPRNSRQGRK